MNIANRFELFTIIDMTGTPRNINFEEVRDTMLEMDGVKDLHDLHLWSLTMSKTAMSVHLAVGECLYCLECGVWSVILSSLCADVIF